MDPRTLIGPTFLVLMLVVATVGSLFLLEPVEPSELTAEDFYTMSGSELKAELTRQMRTQMNRKLIYAAVIGVLICVVPMGNTNRLTRGLILAAIGLVGRFVTGDHAGSMSSLTKMCVLGATLLVVLVVVKFYNKAVGNGKRPATERWKRTHRDRAVADDPETLAKLDRLRLIASGPPPAAS